MTAQPGEQSDVRSPLPPEQFKPVAGVLAMLVPGLGHVLLGQRQRGVMIFAGVAGLFLGGLLIGGIDSVDREEDFVWFLGQALVGPAAFGVDYVHQNHFKAYNPAPPLVPNAEPVFTFRDGKFHISEQHLAMTPMTSVPPRFERVMEEVAITGAGRQVIRTEMLPMARAIGDGGGGGPPNMKSVGRMNELGTLFITIAGMLNLIVILDAFFHRPGGGIAPQTSDGRADRAKETAGVGGVAADGVGS